MEPTRISGARGLVAWMCLLACGWLSACLTPPAQAQDTLRERLKARVEQRQAERAAKDAQADPGAKRGDGAAEGGLQTLDVMGRKVLVHVPTGVHPRTPMPLVMAFHGGGGSAAHMAKDANYGLQRKADEAGFIVAFPNGDSKFPGGQFATWNAGQCCGDARDKGVDDVAFARAVVLAIKARFTIDPSRVYAIGMSNGGMMAHRLACDASDIFAAVASVAGTDATTRCTPTRPVPVLHIHAKDDDHVLYNGGAGPGAFRDASKVMDFVSVPETVARWVKRDACVAAPQLVLKVDGASCEAYRGCAGGAAVQVCTTETGGHSWPGTQSVRRGKEGPSKALDANDVIWRFLLQ